MVNPLSNPFYLMPPLAAFVTSIILIALVLRGARRSSSRSIFCGLLLSLGLWGLLLFGMRSSPDVDRALVWDKTLPVVYYFAFLLYYHFTLTYTNTSGQRPILLAAYLFLGLLIALAPTDLIIERMRLEDYGYAPTMGPVAIPAFMIGFLLMGGAAYNLVKRYKASSSYEERNRLLYLVIALLFPLTGAFLDAFSNLPPAAIWCNLIFCFLCSIAILKYHLLDIQVVIRKSLVYLFVSVTIALPYVGILFITHQILQITIEPWWMHVIVVLFVAIVLRPMYTWAQQFVDRLFYRDRYDHLRALQQFSHQTQSVANLEELGLTLVKLVRGALRSSSAYLLLPSEGKGGLTILSCDGLGNPPPGIILRNESLLVKQLKLHGGILSSRELNIIPSLQSPGTIERQNLENLGAELYIPIKISEGELSGILILGKKLSGQDYFNEERRLLLTLANQMAMALENAHLYDLERTARSELQKQDEQKTEFLHGVAHELKTPLTAIISSSELLSEGSSIASGLRQKLIHNIRQSAESMNRRVAELLDLATMQIGELKIEPEPLEMTHIITEVASQLRVLFKSKKQTLTLEMPDSLPKVKADRGKLEQVLFNLLSNANKFSPTGKNVILRAKQADGKIIVEIEDSAPAVTEDDKRRLFDPYYRGDDPEKRERFAGLGLGLSISRKLVELHQGDIWVENKPTKGNIFAFSLPVLGRRKSGAK